MDWNFLDDSTLWVGISYNIAILIIKPLSSFFLKKIDDQIKSLKEIDEAKDLKAKAEISLNEHKEKQKRYSVYR